MTQKSVPVSEAVKGNLGECSTYLQDAAENASAACNALSGENPLAGQAAMELLIKIGEAKRYADLLLSLTKEGE
jgi:hypothetical protein